jgi:hypothetical protein
MLFFSLARLIVHVLPNCLPKEKETCLPPDRKERQKNKKQCVPLDCRKNFDPVLRANWRTNINGRHRTTDDALATVFFFEILLKKQNNWRFKID